MNWIHPLQPEQISGEKIISDFKSGKKTFSAVEELQKKVIASVTIKGEPKEVINNTVNIDITEETNQDGSDIEVVSGIIYLPTTDGICKLTIESGIITGYDVEEFAEIGKCITSSLDGYLKQDYLRMVRDLEDD